MVFGVTINVVDGRSDASQKVMMIGEELENTSATPETSLQVGHKRAGRDAGVVEGRIQGIVMTGDRDTDTIPSDVARHLLGIRGQYREAHVEDYGSRKGEVQIGHEDVRIQRVVV